MNNVHDSVKKMWHDYLVSIGETEESTDKNYTSWKFGCTDEIADQLAELVYNGEKQATTSLYCLYAIENEPLPKEGDISIITASNGFAVCIIQNTKVKVLPFSHVDEEFANKEGEGDKSLKNWQKIHSNVFSRELQLLNKKFSPGMLVVCEEFKVLYRYQH